MLLVRAKVKPSDIHGLGLFAAEDIPKGTVVWIYDPRHDQRFFTQSVLDPGNKTYPPQFKEALLKYGYINRLNQSETILCCDDARFMNFATPTYEFNLELGKQYCGEERLVARRDIKAGEELTVPVESDFDAPRKLADSIKSNG